MKDVTTKVSDLRTGRQLDTDEARKQCVKIKPGVKSKVWVWLKVRPKVKELERFVEMQHAASDGCKLVEGWDGGEESCL